MCQTRDMSRFKTTRIKFLLGLGGFILVCLMFSDCSYFPPRNLVSEQEKQFVARQKELERQQQLAQPLHEKNRKILYDAGSAQ
jgi:hydrogenase maturation factor HypF (carbamoyltransferase family)